MESYTLNFDGTQLHWTPCSLQTLPCPKDTDAPYTPPAPWQLYGHMGDTEHLWCSVYRLPQTSGAIFVLQDFDTTLMLATAETNLCFSMAMDFFARLVTYPRYAADIFEHADEDNDD